jgi:NAD(P)-dependent dehydrogenase (short-subunit alcohol dehydrogenase family)
MLDGKTALITGGASGIGAGICRHFAAAGASVVIADVDEERGRALAGELGDRAAFHRVDVTSEDDIAAAVTEAAARTGRLDCMVNNAGRVGTWRFVDDITADEWDAAFRLLCRAVFLGIKHAAPLMCEAGGGSIINTGSIAGLRAGDGPHPYGAAKAAVMQLTRSAAVELAPRNVRVNTITPGGVATRIVGHGARLEGRALDDSVERVRQSLRDFQPIPRSGEPEDLAAAAAYLASDAAGFVTGQEIVVDGGLSLGRAWPEDIRAHATKHSPGTGRTTS